MKYLNVLMACAAEPWALDKSKLITVANFLRFKALGGQYSAEEVARITQKTEKEVRRAEGGVALLPIQGVIGQKMNLFDDFSGGTSSELISKQFRAMLNDDAVKAIVLDINSPGGVARSIEEVGREIFAARGIKPIVAQIDTCAASAAYWLAAQADEIVVTPSGYAGSIGVYTIHEDISALLAKEGIVETLIYAGENKVLGNSFEPISKAAKSDIQKAVDELAGSFTRAVARGRGVSLKDVNERFGQGLTFGAEELVERGMADKIATMAETLERFGIDVNPALTRQKSGARAEGGNLSTKFQDWARRAGDGENPAPSEFEDILREAGVSKTQRARIASRMHGALRSDSGEEEANAALETAVSELLDRVRGFKIPKT